jgi:hypothetical protein
MLTVLCESAVVGNASGYGVRRMLRSDRLAMDYVGGFLLCL